jgi:hypothetical protein
LQERSHERRQLIHRWNQRFSAPDFTNVPDAPFRQLDISLELWRRFTNLRKSLHAGDDAGMTSRSINLELAERLAGAKLVSQPLVPERVGSAGEVGND